MICSKLQAAISQACQEIQQLLSVLAGKQKKPPSGNLRVIRNHGRYQYYIVPEDETGNGHYIPKNKSRTAAAIALRDFSNDVQAVLQALLTSLEAFDAAFGFDAVESMAAALHPGRRALVVPSLPPALLPQEEFVKQWLAKSYEDVAFKESHPFYEGAPEFFACNGIRVRSKSEILIADALTRFDIPFRYEQPLTLRTNSRRDLMTVHPDFTCLNPRTREEFIWEHFGRMACSDYAHNAIVKIAQYDACGFTLGKNFIATFEDDDMPLSTKQVQNYIEKFLL